MHVTRLAIPDQFPRLLAQKVARLGRGKAKESALRFHFIRTLKNNVPRLKPRHVLLGALAYLAVSWTVIIAVDFLNLFGLQRFTMDIAPLPMLWYELYSEGSWTERLQWLLLAVALWTTFRLLLLARKQSHTPTYVAATALSCGLLFMLVEDSLNFRHIVSDVYLTAWISDPLPRRIRMVWEVTFYSLLAVLMATGLWFLWRGHRLPPRLWALIMIAYGVYGTVGFASALRRMGNWQERLGEWVIQTLDLARLPAWSLSMEKMVGWHEVDPTYRFTLGYLLTDHLLEETVELIAAALLAAAMLAVSWRLRQALQERAHL